MAKETKLGYKLRKKLKYLNSAYFALIPLALFKPLISK